MRVLALLASLSALSLALADESEWTLETELGAAFSSHNAFAAPGSASRIDATQLTGSGPFLSTRTTLTWEGSDGPGWRLLVAPLFVSGSGQFDQAKSFDGTAFAPGVDTRGTYRFDSYRLTYRNRWKSGPNSDWRIGGTLKVRDAEITVRQGNTVESFKNTGPVPLLHIYGEERLSDDWRLTFDFDGAIGPGGGALDAAVRVHRRISDGADLFLSVRLLDGGADNDDVFTFATFQYVTLGTSLRF